jgi:hypothetical protein
MGFSFYCTREKYGMLAQLGAVPSLSVKSSGLSVNRVKYNLNIVTIVSAMTHTTPRVTNVRESRWFNMRNVDISSAL